MQLASQNKIQHHEEFARVRSVLEATKLSDRCFYFELSTRARLLLSAVSKTSQVEIASKSALLGGGFGCSHDSMRHACMPFAVSEWQCCYRSHAQARSRMRRLRRCSNSNRARPARSSRRSTATR